MESIGDLASETNIEYLFAMFKNEKNFVTLVWGLEMRLQSSVQHKLVAIVTLYPLIRDRHHQSSQISGYCFNPDGFFFLKTVSISMVSLPQFLLSTDLLTKKPIMFKRGYNIKKKKRGYNIMVRIFDKWEHIVIA